MRLAVFQYPSYSFWHCIHCSLPAFPPYCAQGNLLHSISVCEGHIFLHILYRHRYQNTTCMQFKSVQVGVEGYTGTLTLLLSSAITVEIDWILTSIFLRERKKTYVNIHAIQNGHKAQTFCTVLCITKSDMSGENSSEKYIYLARLFIK